MATYETPGKFIVVGEHFVVHGVPAIAAPVTGVTTSVTVQSSSENCIEVPVKGQGAAVAAQVFQAALRQIPQGATSVSVHVESTIPVGFGLGSSAAYSVGLAGALADFFGDTLSQGQVRERAHELEKLIHGAPSGIDDTVISFRRPMLFCRGECQPLSVGGDFHFVLASCQYPGVTKDAVAAVGEFARQQSTRFDALLEQARDVTDVSVRALASGNAVELGRQMDRAHELLSAVQVSTAELDRLVDASRAYGVHGAKLTGGGYGGFMVALVSEAGVPGLMQALHDAGARHVLQTTIGASSALDSEVTTTNNVSALGAD